jgi:hypothetical protein
MLRNITLARPLAIIDLETTGTNPQSDRIVEISILKLPPDGPPLQRTRRLNPGVPIPPAATAVHGITDADVADAPRFEQVAGALLAFLDGCDLCGFNLKRFDLQLLCQEFAQPGLPGMDADAVLLRGHQAGRPRGPLPGPEVAWARVASRHPGDRPRGCGPCLCVTWCHVVSPRLPPFSWPRWPRDSRPALSPAGTAACGRALPEK